VIVVGSSLAAHRGATLRVLERRGAGGPARRRWLSSRDDHARVQTRLLRGPARAL